jgi:hypothetical protein
MKFNTNQHIIGKIYIPLLLLIHTQSFAQNIVHRQAYFGDLHLHTGNSFDAASAMTRTTPDEAYRFAKGEVIQYFGRDIQRKAPLDFLAVTDHSEYLGISRYIENPGNLLEETLWPSRLLKALGSMREYLGIFSPSAFRGIVPPVTDFLQDEIVSTIWQDQMKAAQAHYEPGEFTTFVAYEWSPMPDGAHMHRNVIIKGPVYPELPYTALDSQLPEDLWTWAEAQQQRGVELLLIPHNSNLSDGLMFALRDSQNNQLTKDYAERRQALERLVEITQIKGTSETRPEFAPTDEFADFELIHFGDSPPQGSGYIREALKNGLLVSQQLGVNPFRFGLIGSTDFHSGLSASEEFNFPGGLGDGDEQSNPRRVLEDKNPLMGLPTTVMSSSGLTGIWAESNTRESLFEAMQRREVFATSGTRVQVRMFAGWQLSLNLTSENWVQSAYSLGVPMGGDLPPNEDESLAPTFILHALKDPDSGNLDRIQVIKLWLEDGNTHERIYDAVWNDTRELDVNFNLPPLSSTVDLAKATYTNTSGATELLGSWQDPNFKADQQAVYYARVLEVATPRWSTYLAVSNNLPISSDVPKLIQERAWTSPIFFEPQNKTIR